MGSFEFRVTLPHLDTDEDVEMPSAEARMLEPTSFHAVSISPEPPFTKNLLPSAIEVERSKNQVVLYHSRRRRRRPSETTSNPDSDNVTSSGWRPVRLQGYSEDPMKDEVIRGQTETIKLLQSQLQNMQNGNSGAADPRLTEAEEALYQERLKITEKEKLIRKLKGELEIYKAGTRQTEDQALDLHLIKPANLQKVGRQVTGALHPGPSTSGPVLDEFPMIWDHERTDKGGSYQAATDIRSLDQDAVRSDVPRPPKVTHQYFTTNWHTDALLLPTSVPLPLSFKRARGRRQTKNTPKSPPPPVDPTNPPIWTDASTSTSSGPSVPTNPVTSLEAKIDLILNTLHISGGSPMSSKRQSGPRLRTSEFISPRVKAPKAEGRNERLASPSNLDMLQIRLIIFYQAWVRSQLQGLLGIKQDRDILNNRDTLYAQNTGLRTQMAQFEKDTGGRGPETLEPMQVNWDDIHGRWNEELLGLFLAHCKQSGYGNGQLTDEDEDEIGEIFFRRLERIQGIINEYRPKPHETIAQADKRYSDRHLIKLSIARRNRRRAELFNTRCDINMEHLPDDLEVDQSDEEQRRWIDRYRINEAFGLEGTSSDGTDPYESDAYHVHALKWRNKALSKKMRTTDAARRTRNEYGNSRPGNRPRTRKGRSGNEPYESSRKVPAGLPINCYDESWYNGLSLKKMRDLQAKPPLELLAAWDSD